MGLTIRDALARDGEAIAALLGQLGYETDAAAVVPRLELLVIVGDRASIESKLKEKNVGSIVFYGRDGTPAP